MRDSSFMPIRVFEIAPGKGESRLCELSRHLCRGQTIVYSRARRKSMEFQVNHREAYAFYRRTGAVQLESKS